MKKTTVTMTIHGPCGRLGLATRPGLDAPQDLDVVITNLSKADEFLMLLAMLEFRFCGLDFLFLAALSVLLTIFIILH